MSRARFAEDRPTSLAALAAAISGARSSASSAALRSVRDSGPAVWASAAPDVRTRKIATLDTQRLFMVKRLRRIQTRSAVRRYRAEDHCHGTGKEKRESGRH